MPHQTPDLLRWSLAEREIVSYNKTEGIRKILGNVQLCVSACRLEMKLPAERMIPFRMRGGTGTELTTGDTADLLL